MISGRRQGLVGSYEILKKYGVYFLSQSGDTFSSSVSIDDPGFFLYVPLFSNLFGIDVLVGASVFVGLISFALFCSFMLLNFLIARSLFSQLLGVTIGLFVSLKVYSICEVYSALALAFVPVPLLLLAYTKKSYYWLYSSAFLIGFVGIVSGLIRSYAGLPVYLFFVSSLLFCPYFVKKQKIIALSFVLLGSVIPAAHYQYVVHTTSKFLTVRGFEPISIVAHHFWHNVYIGFGFTRNPYGIIWADECSVLAARKVIPGICEGNATYNTVMRGLVLDLLKNDRHFFFTSLFARLGIIVMFFLLWFGWLGLLCSYFYPKPWYEECAFFLAFAASGLPGLIAVPVFQYLEGFVVCTALYVMYSLIIALNAGMINDVLLLFRKMLKKLHSGTKAYLGYYSDL